MRAVYEFTQERLAELRQMACERNHPAKRSRKIDRSKHDVNINVLGLMGEDAVSRFLEIPITQHKGAVGDGRVCDFQYRGFTVQTKFNSWTHGDFYVNEHDTFTADLGILTISEEENSVRLVGWTTKERFANLAIQKSYRAAYGYVRALEQSLLFPMELWRTYVDNMEWLRNSGVRLTVS